MSITNAEAEKRKKKIFKEYADAGKTDAAWKEYQTKLTVIEASIRRVVCSACGSPVAISFGYEEVTCPKCGDID